MKSVLIWCVLLVSVSCDQQFQELLDEFVNEVVNVKEIERTIRDYLPGENDTGVIDPTWLFVDSWTKIPSGILAGNVFDLGHFDECYAIKVDDIYGKYCLGTLPLNLQTRKFFEAFNLNVTRRRFQMDPEPRMMQMGSEYVGLHWAICVPHNVSAADIPGLLTYNEELCYSKATEPELSDGAIATIVVLSVFLAISAVSTAFDVYLYYAEKKSPHELYIAFSFLTNGSKIFKSSTNPDQLLCLNGVRALSMMWVVLSHEYMLATSAPLYNFLEALDWQSRSANMIILGSSLNVDSFFLVGGLVIVYTFLRASAKGVKFNLILFYVHRYLRLTPALTIAALGYVFLLGYLGNGPLWATINASLQESCRTGWWSTLLYITNYVQDGICLPQAWYLAIDMQLYILSPIILIPLVKWPKPTLWALGFLAVLGCVIPFAIGYSENLGVMNGKTGDQEKYFTDYYQQTYTRFGVYVIGMILGYYIYKIKTKQLEIKMSKLVATLLWLIFTTGLVACVYAEYPLIVATEDDKWGSSLFMAFDRPAWGVGLAGVIFLCVSGYGHPVDWFLSLPIFQFITKLSYSIYLVHYAVITVRYAGMKNTMKFSNSGMFYIFWSDLMLSLALALLLSLMFESPIVILEKYIFGHGPPKKVKEEKRVEA